MPSSFKRPESVLVIVATVANEVLLMRRKDPPGYWQSVTGSLEWGESAEHAACRELREETGLVADDLLEDSGITNTFEIIPPWTEKFAPGVTENHEQVYLYRLPQRSAVELNAAEHVEYRWLPAHEAVMLASSSTDRAAIDTLILDPKSR